MDKRKELLLMIASLCILLCAVVVYSGVKERQETLSFYEDESEGEHIRDNDALYMAGDDCSVVTMYLTVSRGEEGTNMDHTWEEVNAYSAEEYLDMGVERYQIDGLLQVGDERGPQRGQLGYGRTVPNATVQIRGQSSSWAEQKGYKIELIQGVGSWNDQKTIALNKHSAESLRFRNKLAFDLIEEIPQLVGLRTQFVHLYVKDTTGDMPEEFVDYGLYTQVEQLNGRAMRAHGLDENGHLYKVNYFEFLRYEEAIRLEDDPQFDLAAFETHLEIKGNRDHSKLIRMIDAVNDESVSVETLLDTYFDEENLVYWLAFEILIGNVDTQSNNAYLYSPQNSERWYILPWDHDCSLIRNEYALKGILDYGSWECGISNYWGNMVFQRCLKLERFRAELDAAIEEMRAWLSEERIDAMAEKYAQTVKPYVFSEPDAAYIGVTEVQYDALAAGVSREIELNYQLYKESLEKPMPFFIGDPLIENDRLTFCWDPSYDFGGEKLVYSVELSDSCWFDNVLFSAENLTDLQLDIALPAPGQYFVRIRAKNASGHTQDAFDYYVTEEGKHYGMRSFYVTENGIIEAYE